MQKIHTHNSVCGFKPRVRELQCTRRGHRGNRIQNTRKPSPPLWCCLAVHLYRGKVDLDHIILHRTVMRQNLEGGGGGGGASAQTRGNKIKELDSSFEKQNHHTRAESRERSINMSTSNRHRFPEIKGEPTRLSPTGHDAPAGKTCSSDRSLINVRRLLRTLAACREECVALATLSTRT